MAWEAVEAGRWLDHTWNGVVLFEKPPLLFWSLQLSGLLFGWSDLAMRLPGLLAAVVAANACACSSMTHPFSHLALLLF